MQKEGKEFTFNKNMFKEMILYISEKTLHRPNIGSTHFNKILYYADIYWFSLTGRPISGEIYIKKPKGPFASHWFEIIKELQLEKKAFLADEEYHGYIIKKLRPVSEIKYNFLQEEHKSLINKLIRKFGRFRASEVSEITHLDIPWKVLEVDEPIPYEAVALLRESDTPNEAMEWAKMAINNYAKELHE